MDDLIVIILTLVFAAAGIFGQMKKKQEAAKNGNQPQPENQAEEPNDFWDFLNEESKQFYRKEEQVKEPRTQKQPVPEVSEQPAAQKPKYQFKAENEGVSVYADDLTSDSKTGMQERKTSKDRFSLKKAVIYSEILKRKYT
jgi:hypothetical protein